MEASVSTIELNGVIAPDNQIKIDEPLPLDVSTRVHLILFYSSNDEINESEWLQAASKNSVFDFLNDSDEDIYTLEDGKPLEDEI
jgi:hypothetical protein